MLELQSPLRNLLGGHSHSSGRLHEPWDEPGGDESRERDEGDSRDAGDKVAAWRELLGEDDGGNEDHPSKIHHAERDKGDHETGAAAHAVEAVMPPKGESARGSAPPVLHEEVYGRAAARKARGLPSRQLVDARARKCGGKPPRRGKGDRMAQRRKEQDTRPDRAPDDKVAGHERDRMPRRRGALERNERGRKGRKHHRRHRDRPNDDPARKPDFKMSQAEQRHPCKPTCHKNESDRDDGAKVRAGSRGRLGMHGGQTRGQGIKGSTRGPRDAGPRNIPPLGAAHRAAGAVQFAKRRRILKSQQPDARFPGWRRMHTDEDKSSPSDRAPSRAHAATVLILAPSASPWAGYLSDHLWLLATEADEPDVVVCLDGGSRDRARAYPRATVVHVTQKGESWAGEGANIVLYDPSPRAFVEACERGLRLTRARTIANEYVTDILECSPDAFFVLDWERLVTYQNLGALSFVARFEGGDGDITGEPLEGHIPEDFAARLVPVLAQVFRDPRPRRFECTLQGGLVIETSAYFIPSGAAVYFRDLTARRAAESAAAGEAWARREEGAAAAAAEARFEAARSTRNAAEALAVAHQGLRHEIEGAKVAGAEPVDPYARHLDAADLATNAVLDAARALEAPARLPRGTTTRFDFALLVQEAARLHGLAHPGGRPVELTLEPSQVVEGDAPRLQQMVIHLLRDADVRDDGDGASSIRLTTMSEPSGAVLVVETFRERRGRRVGARSVGAALAAAARIAAEHGGTLELLPARAGANKVAIRLPMKTEAPP